MLEALGSSHERVRRLRRLLQKRSERWSEGVFVIEGPDLVSAALDAQENFEAIFIDEAAAQIPEIESLCIRASNDGVRIFSLASGVLEKVADAQTPQPILAAVHMRPSALSDLSKSGFVLISHDIRDPGNAGTLIRSADASGAMAVIMTGQSVDPYNPKTLRATAGSLFRIPVILADLDESISHLKKVGFRVWATVVRGGESSRKVDLTVPTAVVIGNEARGLSSDESALCDGMLTIPMAGGAESLNAGVAGSLLAFEALYQRTDTK